MFKTARLKLTGWYLLIIAFISLAFSLVIYKALTSELDRIERLHRLSIERRLPEPPVFFRLDPEILEASQNRLRLTLIVINVFILSASAVAGYFLAGRTLRPIEEMVEEQKRFVSDASHELRTPLTSIKTEVEVALRDKKLLLGEAKKLLKSNLEEVEKMQKLSNYLLALNKYGSGGTELEKKNLNLAAVCRKAIEKTRPLAKEKKLVIREEVEKIKVQADESSLTQLLTILLDNAIKYSFEKGEIVISAIRKGNNGLLAVRDQGVGIRALELPHIFDRFYRADSSRNKEKADGFGLGLAIAKAVAEANGIEIKVKSQPGKGSTFTLVIPLA